MWYMYIYIYKLYVNKYLVHVGACLDKGQAVVSCVLNVLSTAQRKCPAELNDLRQCLQATSNDFVKCRQLQRTMDQAFQAQ
jgi:hypothetical protein